MSARTILIADDDAAIRTVLSQAITRAGYSVRATSTASSLWQWIVEGQGDAVVTDVVLPDENAFDVLPRIKKIRPHLPVIVMSAKNTIMTAITAAERGAYDYLPKPFDLNALLDLVARAVEQSGRRSAPASLPQAGEQLPIIGRSAAMQEIYRIIARLTQTDLTVMIEGESGTGKELVARAIHDYGKRRRGPFVAVNMAAIPRDLIESELFGHEKGAFTGANQRMAGRFEQAQGGTLFLDEIGDMPFEAQTRLLRVLQQGEYTTIGGHQPIKTNVRIISATHRDLGQMIAQNLFREDLFYRLNVVPIRLPPLRERSDDIPDLARHFLARAEREGLARKQLSSEALERLQAYHWPGNVRELENLMRRTAALHADEIIPAAVIDQELAPGARKAGGAPSSPPGTLALDQFLESHLAAYFSSFGTALPPPGLYDRILAAVEPPLIQAALAATNGNQLKAADLLGLNRNTLRAKIRAHGLKVVRT
jgi:two-component system, NtrC family, nitrogen regulation response regulator GlnG